MQPDVLVVGAGPSGLALALQAHDHGATVRVVERRTGPRPSRALVAHPRTLEALRPLGVVPALAARADRDPEVRLHLGSREVPVHVGDLGLEDSAFGHPWLVRQRDVEEVLTAALLARGIGVEQGTELVDLRPRADHAEVTLDGPAGPEHAVPRWVAGCDGPSGPVRGHGGIGVRAVRYRPEIVLADIEIDTGPTPGTVHVAATRSGVVFVFALGEQAGWRLLATRRPDADPDPPGRGALQHLLEAGGFPGHVTEVAWSTRLRLSRRLADTFRRGPVLLVGDAAHTHSPAAAQGMNLGLQDAVNLGWKLGLASASTAPDRLLDSYTAERRPVAEASAVLTDLVFWAESSPGLPAALLRGLAAPLAAPLVPALLRQRHLTRPGLRLLSGMTVHHRRSPLSRDESGRRGGLRAGDRLPDRTVTSDGRRVRLHELIATPGVHVLLGRDAPAPSADLAGRALTVHRLADRPGRRVVGVRPDGYVGYHGPGADPGLPGLCAWLDVVGAR